MRRPPRPIRPVAAIFDEQRGLVAASGSPAGRLRARAPSELGDAGVGDRVQVVRFFSSANTDVGEGAVVKRALASRYSGAERIANRLESAQPLATTSRAKSSASTTGTPRAEPRRRPRFFPRRSPVSPKKCAARESSEVAPRNGFSVVSFRRLCPREKERAGGVF